MTVRVRRMACFNATVRDVPGAAYRMLASTAHAEVNLLAFSVFPIGPTHTQLVLFPEDPDKLIDLAANEGFVLNGPSHALLVQGDDELGALVEVHHRLADAGINVYSSNGVTDGRGHYGYVIYVRDEDFDRAATLLGA